MAPTNPVINEEAEAREYLQDYPEIHLLNTFVRDRKVYRDAMSEGLSAWLKWTIQKQKMKLKN
jgi:chromosome partitioning protein